MSKVSVLILKGIILLLFVVGNVNLNYAQITVSGSNGCDATNYTSLTAATTGVFAKLNGLSQAGKTILITIDNAAITETGATALTGAAGMWTSLTLRPSVSNVVVSGASTTNALIVLNGVKNVTIDGQIGGSGAVRNLTFRNTATTGTAQTIAVQGGAGASGTPVNIQYCKIQGRNPSNTAGTGGVLFFGVGAAGPVSNYVTVQNCYISDDASGNYPFWLVNSTSATGTNIVSLLNNEFFDNFSASGTSFAAINIAGGNTGWTIDGNKYYQTADRDNTSATFQFLNMSNGSGTGYVVKNNVIGGNGSGGLMKINQTTVTTAKAKWFALTVNTGNTISLINNTVKDISFRSSSGGGFSLPGIWAFVTLNGGGSPTIGGPLAADGNTFGSNVTVTSTATSLSGVFGICTDNAGSHATTVVRNNTISGLTVANSSASTNATVGFYGIWLAGGSGNDYTISDNTISSINLNTTTTTVNSSASQGELIGINVASSYTGSNACSISSNQIYTLYHNATYTNSGSALSSSTNAVVRGIRINTGSNNSLNLTCNGNQIYDLKHTQAFSGTGTSSSIIGIQVNATSSSTAQGYSIAGNKIYNLNNTSTSTTATPNVVGIYYVGPTGGGPIEKNFIHSLSVDNAATNGAITGIHQVGGGNVNARNNMIRLGINGAGSAITASVLINGYLQGGGSGNYLHNSIYIGGTSVSSVTGLNTYAFQRSSGGTTDIIWNNIFVNQRSNSTSAAGSKHYAYRLNGTLSSSNYNVFWSNGTNGAVLAQSGSTDQANINAFRTASSQDANSFVADPSFSAPNGTSATVDLHVNSNTPVEGQGGSTNTATDDYDGATRSSLTAVDIGADAGNFTLVDVVPPTITYTAVSDQALPSTQPTIAATITDNVLVNSTTFKPRLYYKRCTDANSIDQSVNANTSVVDGWKWVEPTSITSTYNFTIDYTKLKGGVAKAGNVIQYFIVAQDNAATPNVGISNALSFGGTTPGSVALVTANLPASGWASYTIQLSTAANSTIAATVGTGSSADFPDITGLCGCFNAINKTTFGANSTITLTVNTDITESGAVWLTNFNYPNVSLTIKDDGAVRTLSGSLTYNSGTAPALFNHVGVNNVKYDGTSKNLVLQNTISPASGSNANTAPVLAFTDNATTGCSNITVTNCEVISNSSISTYAAIYVLTANSRIFGNISITNNNISGVHTGTVQATCATGIEIGTISGTAVTFSASPSNATVLIDGNNIFETSAYGVYANVLTNANNITVSNNKLFGLTGFSTGTNNTSSWTGINIVGGSGHSVSSNIIGGTATVGATITAPTGANGTAMTFTGASVAFIGVAMSSNTNAISSITSNKIQNLSLTGTSNSSFYGINLSGSSLANINSNTIGDPTLSSGNSITHSGTNACAGIYVSTSASGGFTVKSNNIGSISSSVNNSNNFNGIFVNPGGGASVTISDNQIKRITTGAAGSQSCIGINAGNIVGTIGELNLPNVIDNLTNAGTNTTGTVQTTGIFVSGNSNNCDIKYNTISNLTGSGAGSNVTVQGINLGGSGSSNVQSISNNTIFTLSSNSTSSSTSTTAPGPALIAINSTSTSANQTIESNVIYDLNVNSTSGGSMCAGVGLMSSSTGVLRYNKIYQLKSAQNTNAALTVGIHSNAVVLNWNIHNNMISISNGSNTNDVPIMGIRQAASATSNMNYFFNTVVVGGLVGGTPARKTYGFLRVTNGGNTKLFNNVLVNKRSGGSTLHFAIGNALATPATGWAAGNSDYNALYSADANALGEWGTTTPARTFTTWKNAQGAATPGSGGDANSKGNSGVSGTAIFAAPAFVDEANGDLHSAPGQNCFLDGTGTFITSPITINTDFDNGANAPTSRPTSGGTKPDIGADEFTLGNVTHTITNSGPVCSGSNFNITLTPNINSPATLTYSWSGPGSPAFASTVQSPSNISSTAFGAGTYQVTVTDGNGCTSTASTSVTVNANPTITPTSPSVCVNSTVSLTGSGTPATTGTWSAGSGASVTGTNSTTGVVTGVTGGSTPTITYTDINGCQATKTVTVNESPTFTAVQTDITCNGLTNGTIKVTAANGTAPYQFSKDGGTTFTTATNPYTFTGLGAGNYDIEVTDNNGCSSTSSAVTVAEPTAVSVNPTNTGPYVLTQTISLSSGASGGTSPYTYSWTGPNGYTNTIDANPTRTNATAAMDGTYSVTATDSKGCQATGTTDVTVSSGYIWTGAASNHTDWNQPTNWNPVAPVGGPNGTTIDVTIPTTPAGGNFFPILNATKSVASLNMGASASITLNASGLLQVYADLNGSGGTNPSVITGSGTLSMQGTAVQTITGNNNIALLSVNNTSVAGLSVTGDLAIRKGLVMKNGNLTNNGGTIILKSDATGTAYYDDFSNGSAGNFVGDLTVERYIASSADGYRDISSPVATNVADLADDFPVFGLNGVQCWYAYNPYPNVQVYDEALSIVNGGYYEGWKSYTGTGNTLNAMKGIAVRTYKGAPFTLDFTGAPYTGLKSINITKTPSVTTSQDGWNMVGNPYPSPISWNAVKALNGGKTNGSQYAFRTTGEYAGSWGAHNGITGVNGATDEIAIGQGFFVLATGANNTLVMDNSVRVANSTTPYYKDQSLQNEIRLTLTDAALVNSDEIVTYTDAGATAGLDPEYDAVKMAAGSTVYVSFNLNNTEYAINVMQDITVQTELPLIVWATDTGVYTLNLTELNLNGLTPYLKDVNTNTEIDLTQNSPLLNINGRQSYTNYVIVFKESVTTGITKEEELTKIYSSGNAIFVKRATNNIATITVSNLLGQKVIETTTSNEVTTLKLNGPEVWYAFVTVKEGDKISKAKVLITNSK